MLARFANQIQCPGNVIIDDKFEIGELMNYLQLLVVDVMVESWLAL